MRGGRWLWINARKRIAMDILEIDVCKQRLDVALLFGKRCRQAVFANTEVGFGELLRWLGQHRPAPGRPSACLHGGQPATGGLM